MKKLLLQTTTLLIAFLLFAGCTNADNTKPATAEGTSSTLTQSDNNNPNEIPAIEKEMIEKEISGKIDEIIKGANSLNVDVAIKPYSNDPNFKIVNPDASVTDFQTMKNNQVEAFKTLASMNFKTLKQDFTFLENDLVMCTWTGSNEFELKTGEKMKIEPYVGSMLFRKQHNEWSIVYAHETTAPPVKVM